MIFTGLQSLYPYSGSSLLPFPPCMLHNMPRHPDHLSYLKYVVSPPGLLPLRGILPFGMISSSFHQFQVSAWISLAHPGPHPNHISLVSPYTGDFIHFMVLISMYNLYLCYFCLISILFTSHYSPLQQGLSVFCSKMYSWHGAQDLFVQWIWRTEWQALGLYTL